MEDLKYPIWRITAKFDETAYENNSVSFTVSFKEKKTEQEIEEYAKEWWEKIAISEKNKDKGFVFKEFIITSLGEETWYLEWFCHTSLTRYDNEKDAFDSFARFLKRKRVDINYGGGSYPSDDSYMPMGGDDHWRWKYCDCQVCKDEGITIISH